MFEMQFRGGRFQSVSRYFTLAAFFFVSTLAYGDFAEPVRLTGDEGGATQTALSLDPANNAFIITAVTDSLEVDIVGPNLRLEFDLPGDIQPQQGPDIVTSSRGDSFVCFLKEDTASPGGGRDVYLSWNTGGQFVEPVNVSQRAGEERGCRLTLDVDGQPHLVWIEERGDPKDPHHVRYYNRSAGQTTDIGSGSAASIFIDDFGVVHIVYVRDEGIYRVKSGTGGFDAEQLVVNAPSAEGMDVQVVVDENGRLFIVYTSGGSLYFLDKGPADDRFSPPRFLDDGSIVGVEMRIRQGGVLSIAYVNDGDIFHIQGLGTFLVPPALVGEATPEAESDPSVMVDHVGNAHVSFIRGGHSYYTNNAGDVSAEFTAAPRSGEAPREVTFQDLSSGRVQLWSWDFGDGRLSNQQNPVHLYGQPGKYTVSLTVFAADRESTVTKEDYITVQESFNHMEIPDQAVVPNQKGVWFPVLADHQDAIQGFQVHAVFDPNILTLIECTLESTVVQPIDPDIWEVNILDRRCEVGVIFDFPQPGEQILRSKTLQPGANHTLVQLVFDVSNGAPYPGETEVRLVNNSDLSRIFNIFIVNAFSKLPILHSSRVEIKPPFPPPPFFLRGDADGSRRVDISDAIRILQFLFLGGVPPTCMDAADVTDSGLIDISSAIALLQFLFLGGVPPRVPYPNLGIDPTADEFPDCFPF